MFVLAEGSDPCVDPVKIILFALVFAPAEGPARQSSASSHCHMYIWNNYSLAWICFLATNFWSDFMTIFLPRLK